MNPTAKTFPANKLAPYVIPLASLFFEVDEAGFPVEPPVTGFDAVAEAMIFEQEFAAAGLTTWAAPAKSHAEVALLWPL